MWNSGPAIPVEDRQHVFEDFHTSKKDAYKSDAGGMGVGLTLARRLARLMDGDVELEQSTGAAVRFIVKLPVVSGGKRLPAPASLEPDPVPQRPALQERRPADGEGEPRPSAARVTIIRLPDE